MPASTGAIPAGSRRSTDAGYQVITFDNRGHGESGKLYDPAAYPAPEMAEDARRLLDHLGIASAGHGLFDGRRASPPSSTIAHPERVRAVVLAGLAANMIKGVGGSEAIAAGARSAVARRCHRSRRRVFRIFAEQTKSDLKALAACMRSSRAEDHRGRTRPDPGAGAGGRRRSDDIAGPVEPLVEAIPGAKGVVLPRRNHMNAVGDRQHKEAVIKFFNSIA